VGWRALADRPMEGHPMGTYATLATLGPVDEVAEAAA
jgi:hypothetical protein